MAADAERLATVDLASLDNQTLAAAISERRQILDHWETRYREVCIPMAHGIRLFGQVYNDTFRPDDPFAFLDLLAGDAGIWLCSATGKCRNWPQCSAKTRTDGNAPKWRLA
jgi:hypothetical protein